MENSVKFSIKRSNKLLYDDNFKQSVQIFNKILSVGKLYNQLHESDSYKTFIKEIADIELSGYLFPKTGNLKLKS